MNVKEFQDSNKKTYVVDFVKGNEVEKEDKQNATVVSVIRKDFTEGKSFCIECVKLVTFGN